MTELPRLPVETLYITACWNAGGCGSDLNTPLTHTMHNLQKEVSQNVGKALWIIAGDNYYAKKEKKDKSKMKKKIVDMEELASGFTCVENILQSSRGELNSYLLLGNHEYDTSTAKTLVVNKDGNPEEPCAIFNAQKQLVAKMENIELVYNRCEFINETTMLICFNSTIIEEIEDLDPNEKQCVHPLDVRVALAEVEKREVFRALSEFTAFDKCTNLVICCHHPIVSNRVKVEDDNNTLIINYNVANFVGEIISLVLAHGGSPVNIFHLCGDTHFYQRGMVYLPGIELPISQFIVGTGGTELDKYVSNKPPKTSFVENGEYRPKPSGKPNEDFLNERLRYTELETQVKHGFLKIEWSANSFVFFPTESTAVGGRTKKQRKTKRKTTRKRRRNTSKK
jgi:hypothetical protein